MKHSAWRLGIVALFLTATAAAADPVGPEFTYQGQLTQNGSPVNDTVVMKFSLWDAASGGNQYAPFGTQTLTLPVTNGVFTAILNGAGAFDNGDARWLEITVCPDAACASPTTLTPRQTLTAAPYAQYALRPWRQLGSQFWLPSGSYLGIGAAPPSAPLDVRSGASYFRLDAGNSDIHVNGGSDSHFGLFNDGAAGGSTQIIGQGVTRLLVQNTGNVGIGTSSPASLLDVRGTVRLGTSGDLFAPGGYENLRIIRGVVNSDGSAPSGCCFSVSHPSTGVYDITFAQSFLSPPAMVASSTTFGGLVNVVPLSNSSVRIIIRNSTNTSAINGGFHFIVTGER